MKKFFMMAAVCLACLTANAQTEVGTITLQPKVGVNFANLTSDVDNSSMKVGLVAGVEAEYQAAEQFSLSAGLLYSMQGNKVDLVLAKVKQKLDYLNIPILANYEVIPGLKIKAGLQPAFLMNAKGPVADYDGYDTYIETDADIKDDCETFELSIPVGASYEFSDFVIDARYNIGVTNISKGDDSVKNSVFQVTVGYKFAL